MHEEAPRPVALAAPWGGRELAVGLGVAIALYALGSLLAAWLLQRLGWEGTPRMGPMVALTQLGLLLPPLLVMARHGSPLRLLGLDRFRWTMLVEVIGALGLAYCGMMVWALILLPLGVQAQEPIIQLFGQGGWALLSALLVGALMAPVVEEVVFRGFLFGGLLRLFSPVTAVLSSAALFAAVHRQLFAFPVLFLLGVLLALLYYRSRSLWAPILLHFCINSVALLGQFLLAQQGLL